MQTPAKSILITVSGPDYYEALREDARVDGWTRWTIYSGAARGEHVGFYITDPFFAVAARGRVLTSPTPHDEPGSEWNGRPMSDIDDLQLFVTPLPLAALKLCFPAWRYPHQPRSNIRVPAEHAPLLGRLMDFFIRPTRLPALESLPPVYDEYMGWRHYRVRMRRVSKYRRQMLAALARELGLTPEEAVCYVARNVADWPEEPGRRSRMDFDRSLAALAYHLDIPAEEEKTSGARARRTTAHTGRDDTPTPARRAGGGRGGD